MRMNRPEAHWWLLTQKLPLGREDRREGTLKWYCLALADRLAIYGNWPPSRVREKNQLAEEAKHAFIQNARWDFVFQARGDGGYFENSYVLSNELTKALEEIKALAPEALADPS